MTARPWPAELDRRDAEIERGEIEDKIAALEQNHADLSFALGHADNDAAADTLGLALDAVSDELGPLRDRLDELEDILGWDSAREDRRDRPITL
jgi:hypothetical protein